MNKKLSHNHSWDGTFDVSRCRFEYAVPLFSTFSVWVLPLGSLKPKEKTEQHSKGINSEQVKDEIPQAHSAQDGTWGHHSGEELAWKNPLLVAHKFS